jgi:peptide deformylase
MIYTDEKILRTPCDLVLDHEVNDLISKLEEELDISAKRGYPGIGLACPQIGIFKKAAIIRLENYSINLVNCIISEKYDEFIFDNEGCLSFPDRFERTKRYREIVVENNLIYPHKLDHLDGVLLTDLSIKDDIKQQNIKIKIRPNDLCHCGSGKKYKKCHG